MDWTQVDIYTTTAAIDLLSVKLQDLGIRGCVVQDAQDFQEFLEQKDGKWDYLEDGLMELAKPASPSICRLTRRAQKPWQHFVPCWHA